MQYIFSKKSAQNDLFFEGVRSEKKLGEQRRGKDEKRERAAEPQHEVDRRPPQQKHAQKRQHAQYAFCRENAYHGRCYAHENSPAVEALHRQEIQRGEKETGDTEKKGALCGASTVYV